MSADLNGNAPLVLAVPSKGRLQENANAFFARAGIQLVQPRGAREYRGAVKGLPDIEVAYLSASDIVSQLASGAAHLGVTGEDLVREQMPDGDTSIALLTPLGFGHANVVVAAPQAWIDVTHMADLDDVAADLHARAGRKLRVATKYVNLTRRHFARHGVGDWRIVESLGATEGAPAAGTAEVVVDITTTGATLAANGLKVLEDGLILSSEANLAASARAIWGPRARSAAKALLARISAEEDARAIREVRARIGTLTAARAGDLETRFGARLPFGLEAPGGIVTLHCPRGQVFDLAEALHAAGATDVTVRTLDYVFRQENPLLDALTGHIGA
jgi:ATP phosphoribosyltransferase